MIKYSLVVLAAAAVIMSSGCDDSECCGGAGKAPIAVITDGSASGTQLTKSHTETKPLVTSSYTLNGLKSKDTDNDGSSVSGIKSYAWKLDGKKVANGTSVPADGKAHKVELTVTDDEGKTASTVGWVKIEAGKVKPVARFSLAETCTAGEVIDVSGTSSSDSDGTVASYQWSIGSTATTADTTITCPQSGSQKICLVVTDNDGQDSTMVCDTTSAPVVTDCEITAEIGNTTLNGADTENGSTELLSGGDTYTFAFTPSCGTCTWETLISRKEPSGQFSDTDVKECIVGGTKTTVASHGLTSVSGDDLIVNTCPSTAYREIKAEIKCGSKIITKYFKLGVKTSTN